MGMWVGIKDAYLNNQLPIISTPIKIKPLKRRNHRPRLERVRNYPFLNNIAVASINPNKQTSLITDILGFLKYT